MFKIAHTPCSLRKYFILAQSSAHGGYSVDVHPGKFCTPAVCQALSISVSRRLVLSGDETNQSANKEMFIPNKSDVGKAC